MDHKPAHQLRYTADKFNHEYGQREVEGKGILPALEECSKHGQYGYLFVGSISGYGIRYLEYLGYEVVPRNGNEKFYVSFEKALPPPPNTERSGAERPTGAASSVAD